MHRMIEMHSKYDNMHINVMFYALNCINNHVLSCYDCMLSVRERGRSESLERSANVNAASGDEYE